MIFKKLKKHYFHLINENQTDLLHRTFTEYRMLFDAARMKSTPM